MEDEQVFTATQTEVFNKITIGSEENFLFDRLPLLITRFIKKIKKKGLSLNTIRAYRNNLFLFCEFLSENKINPNSYTLFAQELWCKFLTENGRESKVSIKKAQMNIKSFLIFLESEQIMSQTPSHESQPLKQPTKLLLTVPHDKFLTLCHTLKASAMNGDSKAIRDWTLILILGECGLKASEIANLTWGDVWPDVEASKTEKSSHTAGCICVKSGNDERLIPYSAEAAQALHMLREVRANLNLGTTLTSKLFFGYLNVSRSTRSDFLHRHGIKFVVYEVSSEILKTSYNSESLRNHAILRWIKKGLNKEQVATLAGYSSLNSLERFLKSSEHRKTSKRK